MSANSRSGSNTVTGTSGADHLNGGSGDDLINGMGGNDRINGGSGNDTLNGGAGNDIVNGDAGDDLGVYVLSENAGSTDVYDGGSGRDTLQLVMTRAQWQSPAVQADIARFLAFLAQVTNPVNGQATNANFTFSFGLTVSKFEALQIMVDGVAFDPRDEAVTLGNDVMAAGEETASVSVNVLANDNVPDLIATLTNTQPAHGSVVLTQTTGTGAVADTASFVYTPNAAHWQYLAAGQTATDTFTYTVTDSDGDTRTATVTVTITGSNDVPTLGAAVAAGAVTEDAATTVSGDIAFADIDLADTHTASSTADGSGYLGTFTTSVTDNGAGDGAGSVTWSFAVDNAAIQHLAAGQVLTQTYTVTVSDGQGGTVSQPVTVTITGTNDAPTITTADASGGVSETNPVTAPSAPSTPVLAEVESNDTFATAQVIDRSLLRIAPNANLGDQTDPSISVNGSVAAPGAQDVFRIDLAAGELITLDIDFAARFGSGTFPGYPTGFGLDSFIFIYDAAGNLLNFNDDASRTIGGAGSLANQDSYLQFAAQTGGTFYIVVRNWDGGGAQSAGPYTLQVSVDSQNLQLTDTGTITFADVDLTDAHSVAVAAQGSDYLGVLSAAISDDTTGDGAGEIDWTFSVANAAVQFLGAGETRTQTYAVTVSDGNGGTVSQNVTVTITGENDGPVISTAFSLGTATEDAGNAATGVIAFDDVDLIDTHTVTSAPDGTGYVGSFSAVINDSATGAGAGEITWTFNASAAELQYLAAGQSLLQRYTVTLSDGNGGTTQQLVNVTIVGTNDAPTITAAVAAGTVVEDGQVNAAGVIDFGDVDLRDGHTIASAAGGENYLGAFTATLVDDGSNDGAGSITWNFVLDNAAAENLNSGDVLTQTYTVTVSDGAGGSVSQVVTIRIEGSDDNTAPTVNDLTLTGTTTGTSAGFPLVFSGHNNQGGTVVYSFADTNGDGRPDAPSAASSLANTSGSSYGYGLAVGDVDGDGDLDVVMADNSGLLSFTNIGDVTGDGYADYQMSTLISGWGSYDVALSDLNGDGRLDVVTSRYYSGVVELTNNGDANGDGLANDFTTTNFNNTNYADSYAITTADMNGDGREDILVSYYYNSPSLLYINDGDTDGDGRANYTSQALNNGSNYNNMGIDTGDIDGDGDIDFVMGSWGNGNNTLYLNDGDTNGDGRIDFTQVQLSTGTANYTMESALIDIDGDGDLDVVAIDAGNNQTTISYNQGDLNGDQRPDFTYQTLQSAYAYGVAVGDVDDDGDLDIVIPSPNGPMYLQNQGDLDGNGQLDFVNVSLNGVASSWDASFTSIGGGSGGGTGVREDGRAVTGLFEGDDVDEDDDAASLTYSITSAPSEGTVVNNGDGTFSFSPGAGFQDLAFGETRTVTFTYTATDSHGAVSNTGTVTVNVAGANDRVMAGADTAQALENGPAVTGNVLLNDSDVDASDVLTVSQVNGSGSQVGVQTVLFSGALVTVNADGAYVYDPNGAFEGLAAGETATDTFSYQVTDGNGGQVTQTVTVTVTGSNDAPVVSDVRTGGAGFPLVFSGYSSTGLAVYSFADSNGDGRVDTPDSSSPLSGSYNYYYNTRMAVGDIDGDGDTDVVIGGNGVTVFTNVGDTTGDGADDFVQSQLDYNYTQGVELADLNGDGLLDIVTAPYYGSLTQFINQGDANNDDLANDFSAQSSYSSSYYSRGVSTGDLNGDGREDVIVTGYYNSEILFNQGDTNNDGQIDYVSQQLTAGYYYDNISTATGDIDGDGDIDFVVSRGGNSEMVYINNGDADGDGQVNFSTVEIYAGGYTEESELVDIDGDGDLDIVSSDYYGSPSIAYNQGDTNQDGNPDFVVQNLYSPFTSYGNRGVAVGDIDGDGDLDIVLPSENGNASYMSNEGDTNNDGQLDFVAVQLNGVGSSWDADFTGASAGAREDGPAVLGRFRGDDVDSDDDRDSLTYTIVSQPAEGSVVNNGDGTFSFSPGVDFQDLDSGETRTVTFTYTATDAYGAVSSPATVTIVVSGRDEETGGGASAMVFGDTFDAEAAYEAKGGGAEVLPGMDDDGPDTGKAVSPEVLPGAVESASDKGVGPEVLPGAGDAAEDKDGSLVLPGVVDSLTEDDFLLYAEDDGDFGPQILPGVRDTGLSVFDDVAAVLDLAYAGLEQRRAMLFIELVEPANGASEDAPLDYRGEPDMWAG